MNTNSIKYTIPEYQECDGKITLNDETISTQQLEARKWLNLYETEYLPLCLEATEAAWEQASNITDYNSMKNVGSALFCLSR